MELVLPFLAGVVIVPSVGILAAIALSARPQTIASEKIEVLSPAAQRAQRMAAASSTYVYDARGALSRPGATTPPTIIAYRVRQDNRPQEPLLLDGTRSR